MGYNVLVTHAELGSETHVALNVELDTRFEALLKRFGDHINAASNGAQHQPSLAALLIADTSQTYQ
jgi:hypothetical protein